MTGRSFTRKVVTPPEGVPVSMPEGTTPNDDDATQETEGALNGGEPTDDVFAGNGGNDAAVLPKKVAKKLASKLPSNTATKKDSNTATSGDLVSVLEASGRELEGHRTRAALRRKTTPEGEHTSLNWRTAQFREDAIRDLVHKTGVPINQLINALVDLGLKRTELGRKALEFHYQQALERTGGGVAALLNVDDVD